MTDKEFGSVNNAEIVNVSSQKANNYAISEAWGTLTNDTLYTGATVTSYTSDAALKVELYINDSDKAAASTEIALKAVSSKPVRSP